MSVRDSFEALSQRDLAVLVPELLLCGQLIDRSGMAHLIVEFGREGMAQVAVEEWESASPWYTRRMQKALGYEGDDVVTIFKGLQLDIGAPPPAISTPQNPTSLQPWSSVQTMRNMYRHKASVAMNGANAEAASAQAVNAKPEPVNRTMPATCTLQKAAMHLSNMNRRTHQHPWLPLNPCRRSVR